MQQKNKDNKLALIEALPKLLPKMKFNSVTIKDITDKAGVSRLTFYHNFVGKEDIMNQYYDHMLDLYFETQEDASFPDFSSAMISCLSYWQDRANDHTIELSEPFDNLLLAPLGRYMKWIFNQTQMTDRLSSQQTDFLIGGFFQVMLQWLKNPGERSAADVVQDLLRILQLPA